MKILVIGDSCKDIHIYGRVDRLCPEAPVPVLIPEDKVVNGGMAANVFANIKSLGVDVDIITHGMYDEETPTKTRYIDSYTNQMIIRVDSGPHNILPYSFTEIDFTLYDSVIISDYNKGFLDYDTIEYICNQHSTVFIDTKKILTEAMVGAKYIKINFHEYTQNINAWHIRNDNLLDIFKDKLIITTGKLGAVFQDKTYPVDPVDVKDMSGAGDTFLSGLVVEYSWSGDIDKAINYANECATIVVQHRGVTKVGDYI